MFATGAVTLLVLLGLTTRSNPLRVLRSAARELSSDSRALTLLVAVGLVLGINTIQVVSHFSPNLILLLLSAVSYAAAADWPALRRLVVGFTANYLVALPFYLFTPVRDFPSLHMSLALTYALIAWRSGHKRLAVVLTTGAALIVLSTIYLGVQWIVDLLGAVLLAVAAAGFVPRLARGPVLELSTGK